VSSPRELLFALTRQRFTRAHRAYVEAECRRPIDWTSVRRIAAAEGVAPIAGVNLMACDQANLGVPADTAAHLERALFENSIDKAQRRAEFGDQVRELDARGYDVLLLKSAGLEAAGVYHYPWVTSARDLDILLRSRNAGPRSRDDSRFLQTLNEAGVENDRDPTEHHDLSINGVVRWPGHDLWRAAQAVRFEEAPAAGVYVLCPEDQLWTLCLNSCRKRFFRLKTLFDIAETVTHYPDLDWDRFARRVRASESEGIVFAALRAADATLGLPSMARPRYAALISRRRAFVLASFVTLLRRSPSRRRMTRTALQYASFTHRQRWRSATLTMSGRLPRRSAAERAGSRLPGE